MSANNRLNNLPAAEYANLYTFWLPDVKEALTYSERGRSFHYTNWHENIVVGQVVYASEPSISFTMDNPNNSGSEPAEFTIQCRRRNINGQQNLPFEDLTSPFPYGRVRVEIKQLAPGHLDTLQTVIFGDVVTATSRNKFNNQLVKLACQGVKRVLKQAAEISALTTCTWRFGSLPCGFDLEANSIPIVDINRNIDGFPNRIEVEIASSPDFNPLRWRRGFIRNDENGARIMIRNLLNVDTSGPNPILTLDMAKVVSFRWDSDPSTLVPGCDKQIAACRVHGREESHMALGRQMPGYNPAFYSN